MMLGVLILSPELFQHEKRQQRTADGGEDEQSYISVLGRLCLSVSLLEKTV